MVKMSHSVCQRIRRIKNSLENAEQSFLDNKDMRGELDLMLAEAEFSNLRRKKDVPWSWNRQLLAVCAAVVVAASCFGGWCYARHNIRPQPSAPEYTTGNFNRSTADAALQEKAEIKVVPVKEAVKITERNDVSADMKSDRQLKISDTDMRRLVKSARVELTSSK